MLRVPGRIVIRDAVVPAAGEGATVVVEDRRIAAVAPRGQPVEGRPGDWDVDADGRLVVAGQIDVHTSLALGHLVRRAGVPGRPPATLADLRAGLRDRLETRVRPDAVAALARAAAVAALRAGTTCVFDLLRAAPGSAADALEAQAGAVADVGLRAVLAWGGGASRGGSPPGGEADVRAGVEFAGRREAEARLRGAVGLSGLPSLSAAALDEAAAAAPRIGIHASVAEDESDLAHVYARWGRRPVDVLAAHHLLGPRTLVAHGATTVHSEAMVLSDTGATLAVTPRSAAFWGAPLPPLLPFAALGVRLAFGTDGLFPDPAGEALAAVSRVRGAERSTAAAEGLVGAVAWPSAARLASEWFGDTLGAVETGALADLVVLDWRPAAPLPEGSAGDLALLWAGAPAAWTIVDGEVRLREGRLLGADEAEIAARAREAAAALLA